LFPRIATYHKKDKTYQYLVISESIRKNGQSTIRDIAQLGNIERFITNDVENIIDGLIKIFKLEKYALSDEVEMVAALEHGSIIFWQKFWQDLKLASLIKLAVQQRHPMLELAVEKYVEMMTINRCIAPESKLGVMTRWLPTTSYAEMQDYADLNTEVNYFYRSLDYLIEVKEELETAIFERLRNLFSVTVKLTFYDITSTYFYGEQSELGELGYSRDGRSECDQVVVGVVTSYEGYPLKHYVFKGNTVDSTTVKAVVLDLKQTFHIEETIFVGDRGMITKLNLADLENQGFDYIMGVKMRQDELFEMLLQQKQLSWPEPARTSTDHPKRQPLQIIERRVGVQDFLEWKTKEILHTHGIEVRDAALADFSAWLRSLSDKSKVVWKTGLRFLRTLTSETKARRQIMIVIRRYVGRYERTYRFVICRNPLRQAATGEKRGDALKRYSKDLDKVLGQTAAKPVDEVEKALNKVFEGHAGQTYRKFFILERTQDRRWSGYRLNESVIAAEADLDGVFALLSKRDDLPAEKVVESYKNLQEVETLFDDFKNFVEVRPIRHRLEKRVRAHIFICILALLLKRIFEINYLGNKSITEALTEIACVKLVKYKLKFSHREERQQTLFKVTTISPNQQKYFKMIGMKNPTNLEPFLWYGKKK
jgi:hypothetical protein